ncbi:glycosyl transferase family 1 [Planococcus antarcticus DSM 14505]|uniref:Glycosyl transferase family 1 n=1 Tax=Planococcus antarcticus DSM 14505 TaxID=1185653 RepID=A0ABM6D4R8_9BACL|nr:glycosyltransferase family 4 protein [Planococcus antarcticus]ANU10188.1 glycosyl transferase family 1 [Planococcus antarcticus DSM 14505]
MIGTKKRNLIFVGPLPPPILGESIALQSLYKSEKLHRQYKVKKINLSRKDFEHPGALSFDKVWTDSFAILYSGLLSLTMKNPILYISISQTKMGLLRDCMMIQACKLLGRGKVVTHLHGNNLGGTIDATSGITQKFIINSLKKIDVGIVLGEKLSPNYRGYVKWVEVVSNGIPADFILGSEVVYGKKKGPISLLYLSNLMFEKGYVELIKATTALVNEGHDLRLDLVGGIQNETEFQEVKQYIAENDMDQRIQYHGLKQGEEKKRFFLESDMMALPTKYKVEGQPMSIIEGMAAGLPIISSDRGIIAELIKDCGVIIEPTVEGVKAAIKDLVIDDAERMRLGRISRETFEAYYTEDKYTDALIDIFDEL